MLHEKTQKQIENLCNREPRNVVLYGPRGLGKRAQAIKLACKWIGVSDEESLETQPDFLLIEPEEGALRSEQAEKIQQKATYRPDKKAVCVVDGAELMTMELQNKLLKVLEDSSNVLAVIFVSTAPLLDTVMSRCVAVPFVPFGLTELYEELEDVHLAALLASDGCPGVYERILSDEWFDPFLDEFLHAILGLCDVNGSIKILELVHGLKEKDREYLPEKLEVWQMVAFLCLIKNVYFNICMHLAGLTGYEWIPKGMIDKLYNKKEAEEIYFMVSESVELSRKKGKFSKNDFFGLFVKMLPMG